jgi:cytochrome b561
MVLIIGILLANLVAMWIEDYLLTYRWKYAPHIFTWIGMAVLVLIYYPLFTRIDKWATKAGNKFIRAGKKLVGREIGTILAFFVALLILFFLYGLEWFDSNVFESFFRSL